MSEESDLSLRLHNAKQAIKEIQAGNASGFIPALYGRALVESAFEYFGKLITIWPPLLASVLLAVVILTYGLLCIGFMNSELETDVADLWIETGGRLDSEIDYTDQHVTVEDEATSEIIIHLVNSNNFTASLYDHLQIMRAATKISVEFNNRTILFRNVCGGERFITGVAELDRVIREALPCIMLTPLDCYWEGSLLQAPDEPVDPIDEPGCLPPNSPTFNESVTWGNLDFEKLSECLLNSPGSNYTFFVDQLFRSSEITGYNTKKCFSPLECPLHITELAPDPVQNELKDGCTSFTRLLAEPRALLIDGRDFIQGVPGAFPEAMRSSIPLNGPPAVQENFLRYHGISYTRSEVEQILTLWKEKFFDLVISFNNGNPVDIGFNKRYTKRTNDEFYGWTSDTAENITEDYSDFNFALIIIGYVLMIIYCGITFLYLDWVNSRVSVGLVGLLLVVLATAAALGFTSACGISFNFTTTQIFPFLVLGVGVDDMFVIGDAFFEIEHHLGRDVGIKTLLSTTLRVVGPSITLTSITNAAGFFLSAVIPIPAIRNFAIQVGCAVVFNYFSLVIGLSSYLVLDYYRVHVKLVDLFCCIPGSICCCLVKDEEEQKQDTKPKKLEAEGETQFTRLKNMFKQYNSPITVLVVYVYSPLLQNYIVKTCVIAIFCAWFGVSVWGCTKVEDGLDFADALPVGTVEHSFASANLRHFAAYSFSIVTKDIDYGNIEIQKTLLRMNEEVTKATYVQTAGGITAFWLDLMITYYNNTQSFYEQEYCARLYSGNQSAEILGYTYRDVLYIMIQLHLSIGTSNNFTELQFLVAGCNETVQQLVIRDGENAYIPPDRFNQYVAFWSIFDSIQYGLTGASFSPTPPDETDPALLQKIATYGPLLYAERNLFAEGLAETSDFETFINEIREFLESYEQFGIDSYPSGPPFLFWEQYINLRRNIGLACGLILVACFIATTFFLMDLWSAVILVCMLAAISTEVFAVTGFLEIKFSSIPGIMIISSVGVAVEFTAPLTFYFLKASPEPGKKKMSFFGIELPSVIAHWFVTRNERMHKALEHRFTPVFNGSITTFLGIIMLAFSGIFFVRLYFFAILMSIVLLGMLNGLILLPVLLSLVGPPAQAYPKEKEDTNGIPLEARNEGFGKQNSVLY